MLAQNVSAGGMAIKQWKGTEKKNNRRVSLKIKSYATIDVVQMYAQQIPNMK
jgi:hypothetical protein